MKLFEIINFKETIDSLFAFFEKYKIHCYFGSIEKLKEAMEAVYQSEVLSWKCIPNYPSLCIEFKLFRIPETREVYYFLFQDMDKKSQNSVLFELSSFNDSISFIRFELYTSRYLPFVLGLADVPGSIEVYTSDGQDEELDEIDTSEIMSLTEFETFLSQHPVPGKIIMVEVE